MTRPLGNKRRFFFLGIAAVLLAIGGTWLISSRGGIVNALHLPPVRDSSTPATQHGFTLDDIILPQPDKNGDPQYHYQGITEYMEGLCGLWIETSLAPTEITQGNMVTPVESGSPGPGSNLFSVTAQTPMGDTLSLPWKMTQAPPRYDGATNTSVPGNSYLLTTIPTGYPNSCRYIDVTVSDTKGHTAHWRIMRLPRTKQILTPPVVVQNKVTTHGITVTADAWRDGDGYVESRFRPILPPNSHQWDINNTGNWLEYEPYGYHTGPTEISHSHPIVARNGVFTDDMEKYYHGVPGEPVSAPYRSSSRFIRFTSQLRQFETYDETVTFHNISIKQVENWIGPPRISRFLLTQPQSVTTPSGITVTLPVQGRPQDTYMGPVNVIFNVQPSQPLNNLPRSPLAKKYGKPVSLDYVFPPPFRVSSWSEAPGPTRQYALDYDISTRQPLPSRLKDFSIIIRQRVDLQTLPMTFTVPVKDPAPEASYKPNTP